MVDRKRSHSGQGISFRRVRGEREKKEENLEEQFCGQSMTRHLRNALAVMCTRKRGPREGSALSFATR